MRWGLLLCTCNRTLPWDAAGLARMLALAEPPVLFDRLPRDEIHRFMDVVADGRVDRLLVACCGPEALFREAAGGAGVEPGRLVVVNVRESCFWPHPDPAAANAKAARTLRAAARLAEPGPAPELPVSVGRRVVVATDCAAGLDLARELARGARPILLLDEQATAFDAERLHPLPWEATWGRLAGVEGRLGAFRVAVARSQPIDLRTCIHCQRCVPVCHTAAITPGLRLRTERCDRCGDCLDACRDVGAIRIPRSEVETIEADQVVVVTAGDGDEAGAGARLPRRTGHRVVRAPGPGEVAAVAAAVLAQIGEFRKPDAVAYASDACAGGAADRQACGLCIAVCPYEAIARDPADRLRVRVDAGACEGCGACVAACPTSALTFTDPPPERLYARLAALLALLGGGRPTPAPAAAAATPAPVVAFHCPESGAAALADAARLGLEYPAGVLPVPMACLRHVSEANMLAAFRLGAAGVALLGCTECPHGPRAALLDRLAVVRGVLEALGLGAGRAALVTAAPGGSAAAVRALADFAAGCPPPPVRWDGRGSLPAGNREVVLDAVAALLDATGREPGLVPVPAGQPFAVPEVRATDCTLSRACVNVCPTHAFRFAEATQALELRRLACVSCGLCVAACPERAISLRPGLPLERRALGWDVVARDEPVACAKCGTPFANRRALAAVEARLAGIAHLADTFAGGRRELLRMCPNCRAVAAVLEMQQGWEP